MKQNTMLRNRSTQIQPTDLLQKNKYNSVKKDVIQQMQVEQLDIHIKKMNLETGFKLFKKIQNSSQT